MMILRLFVFLCGLLVLPAQALDMQQHPKLMQVAKDLANEGHYNQAQLKTIFDKVKMLPSVLEAMQNPAEHKLSWGRYRKIFLNNDRIEKGVDFWKKYQYHLERAAQEFGVPEEIIVAIIAVESKFGAYKGKHKVLDSLTTLVLGFPRRSKFFTKELKEFLILSRENKFDPNTIYGSYAGAMGYPQFIASSYRNYAIDFTNDRIVDLINQPVDAIGSVANYFSRHGWKTGQPVTLQIRSDLPVEIKAKANRQRKTRYSARSLRQMGLRLNTNIADDEKLNIIELEAGEMIYRKNSNYKVRKGDTVWSIARKNKLTVKEIMKLNAFNRKATIYVGQKLRLPLKKTESKNSNKQFYLAHKNFYVITKYNHSVLYAMAVHDLAQEIKALKNKQTSI